VFHAPDKRRRDLDNLLASMKPHLDGLALAVGVDDAGWSFTVIKGSPVTGGCVVLDIFNSGLPRP
jgi:crossover junction endodeoxyribonuclease RusA